MKKGFRALMSGMLPGMIAALLLSDGVRAEISAENAAQLLGFWSGGDSIVEVSLSGDGLSMTLVAFSDAVYRADEGTGEPGSPRRDDNNPDPALKSRGLLGLDLLSDYHFGGKRWEGKIYDPKSGNTYSSRMELDDGRLKMRGYVGTPMFGRNQFFDRLEQCDDSVRAMAAASDASLALCD